MPYLDGLIPVTLAFSLPGFMTGYRRFQRWIDRVVAGLFALAGVSLIRSALDR